MLNWFYPFGAVEYGETEPSWHEFTTATDRLRYCWA
ncbi:hypothetical protein CA51_38150 [Rosistilla oblonga]|nr:hypothetical protein CA51_38150 [Rosistilla oblonga]